MPGALNLRAWVRNLAPDDPEREFLMAGVRQGFRITNLSTEGARAYQKNQKSAISKENRGEVEKQIKKEIENGRYTVVEQRPTIVSALAAIPKGGGRGVWLIHDASRPQGTALNDYSINPSFRFSTIQEAGAAINRGDWLAKVDLESAYRSVKIHPEDHHLAGLEWTFDDGRKCYLIDRRLMFGARLLAAIFNSLTQAVCRMMKARGYQNIWAFLDDYLIKESTQERCQQALNELMGLLQELGFSISYPKVVSPARRLAYLGVEIDTMDYVYWLPEEKLEEMEALIVGTLRKRSVNKKELQSLAGKMNWFLE